MSSMKGKGTGPDADGLAWLAAAMDDSIAAGMAQFAGLTVAYYENLIAGGLPTPVALMLTQAFVESMVRAMVKPRAPEIAP